jgi:hypothetical protein
MEMLDRIRFVAQLVKNRHYTHRAAAGVLSEIAWLRQL